MTRIAILADIHGNLDALSAVLDEAKLENVKSLIVCGDIAGYYYDTPEVWAELNKWDAFMCRGNHENILKNWARGNQSHNDDIAKKYGSSYQMTFQAMLSADFEKLTSLAHPVNAEIDNVKFCVSHGAPWDEDLYLYPDKIADYMDRLVEYKKDYDVVLLGHTHYPFFLQEDNFLVLNPGSVGQPRSGKKSNQPSSARAQWALYDTEAHTHTMMTSYYDPRRIFEQADKYDPHLPYLRDVLTRQDVNA